MIEWRDRETYDDPSGPNWRGRAFETDVGQYFGGWRIAWSPEPGETGEVYASINRPALTNVAWEPVYTDYAGALVGGGDPRYFRYAAEIADDSLGNMVQGFVGHPYFKVFAALTGAPAIPGIEPPKIIEGDLPLPAQRSPTEIAQEALMSWTDDWGFDSGTFQDVFQGVSQVQQLYRGLMDDSGNQVPDSDGGEMIPTMGSIGGGVGAAVATGGIWLGSLLARAFGRTAASAVFTAANGVRVRIAQLWPLVRKYGAQNVAGALGITVGALGTLLMQPGASRGTRKRARGISARDVKTTKRTIGQLRKLTRMAGIGGGGGGYRRSYYRPRRRRYARYC